jgi:hypothetical protein
MKALEERLKDLPSKEDEFDHMMDQRMRELEERLRANQEFLEETSSNFRQFDAELTEQLIKDGYIDKDEEVNTINWGESELTVNGKKIKEADQPRYQEIRKKYFKDRTHRGRPQ